MSKVTCALTLLFKILLSQARTPAPLKERFIDIDVPPLDEGCSQFLTTLLSATSEFNGEVILSILYILSPSFDGPLAVRKSSELISGSFPSQRVVNLCPCWGVLSIMLLEFVKGSGPGFNSCIILLIAAMAGEAFEAIEAFVDERGVDAAKRVENAMLALSSRGSIKGGGSDSS